VRFLEVRQGVLGHQERRPDVVLDHHLERFHGHVLRFGHVGQHPGVVDQDVELAVRINGELHALPGVEFFGDVAEVADGVAAPEADGGGYFFHRVVGQAVEHEHGPFQGKFMGNGFPDAGAGARDDGNFAF
jgi:hypothetical protein